MTLFEASALIILISALMSYVNAKLLKLPETIGLSLLSLCAGVAVLIVSPTHSLVTIQGVLESMDFKRLLLQGMLSVLLFAGGLQVELGQLRQLVKSVTILATIGVVISTGLVGFALYGILCLIGSPIDLLDCLLFGALISPTDPVSVIAMLKKSGLPAEVRTLVAAESLFNDGTGIIIFTIMYDLVVNDRTATIATVGSSMLITIGGGLAAGVCFGAILYLLMRSVDNFQLEIFLSLGVVLAGYSLAHRVGFSGPLAMVVAGIIVGNYGRKYSMSTITKAQLDGFWNLVDEIVNAILFVLMGIQIVYLEPSVLTFVEIALAVVIVFWARWVTLHAARLLAGTSILRKAETRKILLMGGLRGGISIALSLSLPPSASHHAIIGMTYGVVLVSIIVQGLLFRQLSNALRLRAKGS
jgi:CPA1 family monovalent cation:H+ antiporter